MRNRYARSQALLERAERVIPLGSQTFSKSRNNYPQGAAPLFLTRGQGARVWDVDGNEYVDLVCGLLPVILGYCDPDVDHAIAAQLEHGISFSLSNELEIELSELLVGLVPCADMVRLGKNGSDATSAAVRLARAFTGRDHIAAAGYHGWQDWYIGATSRHEGVPAAVRALTHRFPYGDLHALDKVLATHPDGFAAVVMEPAVEAPPDGYLGAVRELTHRHGALLIFDEVISGFRIALGGAQEHFGVTPDLAAFGKSMGNGMPIAAVLGRGDVMRKMEDIFYSSTFAGETLSLSAALATIRKMQRDGVVAALWQKGEALAGGVLQRITARGLSDAITLGGLSPWTRIGFPNTAKSRGRAVKTLFVREMLRQGVLVTGSHNVCHALDTRDHVHILAAYDAALDLVAEELATGRLEERLGCPVIEPVFQVRDDTTQSAAAQRPEDRRLYGVRAGKI